MKYAPFAGDRAVRPLRVLLLLGNWVGGGAERVAVHLMNALPPHWDVRLGLLHAGSAWMDELDPARVLLAPQAASRFRYDRPNAELFEVGTLVSGALHGPRAFRAMIEETRPDVVLSFLKGTAILTWLALAGIKDRPRWIAREGNNIFATAQEESPNALVRRASLGLTACAYRRADAVLTNARDMARDLTDRLRLSPERVHTIPNPVDIARVRAAAARPLADKPLRPFLLSAGRLEYQKGHDILLRAFAASRARATHDLVILGQGSLEPSLRALAAELGLGQEVRFVGFQANPHAWMAQADLFVMPSRWEGFPNSAAEAMAAGAPLLLADCDYGPRELMVPGVSGTLVPVGQPASLAGAIDRLLGDPALRAAYRAAGQARVDEFAIGRIVESYGELLLSVADFSASEPGALRNTPRRVPHRDARNTDVATRPGMRDHPI